MVKCLLQCITTGQVNLFLFVLGQFLIEGKDFIKLRPHFVCIVLCDIRRVRQGGD